MSRKVFLLTLGICFYTFSSVSAQQLLNADFVLGEVGGVAFEWTFEGSGKTRVENGNQIIEEIPPGSVASLHQTLPLCSPGSRYRAYCELIEFSGLGMAVFIGLGPKLNPTSEEIVWNPIPESGIGQVEAVAQDTNLTVYLAAVNTGEGDGTSGGGSVVFGSAGLESIQQGIPGYPAYAQSGPSERLEARSLVEQARQMLLQKKFHEASDVLEYLLKHLPNARPEAAMALVRMQEADHSKQFLSYKYSKSEWPQLVGIPHLRAVLERYPEQTEACSLARCKIGEHYLENGDLEMAKVHLEMALNDYPGSEGEKWAKVSMVKWHEWSGDHEAAARLYGELGNLRSRGEITDEQYGWAELYHELERVRRVDGFDGMQIHLDDMWNRYRQAAPSVAVYCKYRTIRNMVQNANTRMYQISDAYEELVAGLSDHPELIGSYAAEWGSVFRYYIQNREQLNRIIELLTPLAENEAIADDYRERIKESLSLLDPEMEFPEFLYNPRQNLLANPFFRNLGEQYNGWDIYGDSPNWPDTDWYAEDRDFHRGFPPAWNSVNCGEPRRMEAVLVSTPFSNPPGKYFEATIVVAAEGFLGGNLDEVFYEIEIHFLDGQHRPLEQIRSGPIPSSGNPKAWQKIVLTGQSPENTRESQLRFRFVADGPGHHAVCLDQANLYFPLEEN